MMPGEATDRFAETMENLTKTVRMSCPPTADTSCRVKFDPHIWILFWLPSGHRDLPVPVGQRVSPAGDPTP